MIGYIFVLLSIGDYWTPAAIAAWCVGIGGLLGAIGAFIGIIFKSLSDKKKADIEAAVEKKKEEFLSDRSLADAQIELFIRPLQRQVNELDGKVSGLKQEVYALQKDNEKLSREASFTIYYIEYIKKLYEWIERNLGDGMSIPEPPNQIKDKIIGVENELS